VEKPIQTKMGEAILQKTDIFRKIMWFSFNNDMNWISVPAADVSLLLELNKKGIKPNSLQPNDTTPPTEDKPRNQDLNTFEQKLVRTKTRTNPRKGKPGLGTPN